MRKIILTTFGSALIVASAIQIAAAAEHHKARKADGAPVSTNATLAGAATYPVCLAGGQNNANRCDYANLEQCQATASGGLGYCVPNPRYTSNAYARYRRAGKRIF